MDPIIAALESGAVKPQEYAVGSEGPCCGDEFLSAGTDVAAAGGEITKTRLTQPWHTEGFPFATAVSAVLISYTGNGVQGRAQVVMGERLVQHLPGAELGREGQRIEFRQDLRAAAHGDDLHLRTGAA